MRVGANFKSRKGSDEALGCFILIVLGLVIAWLASVADDNKKKQEARLIEAKEKGFATVEEYDAAELTKKVAAEKQNPLVLAPMWYVARYNPNIAVIFGNNQLMKSIFFLSALLFPVWGVIFEVLAKSQDKYGHDVGPLFWGVSILPHIVIGLLTVFLYFVLYFALGIFDSSNPYIPIDFIGLLLYFASHGLGAVVLGLTLQTTNNNSLGMRKASESSGRNNQALPRFARTLRAMSRAALVAIATGIGSQIGGWIGGLCVFVITSGLAAYFNFTPPSGDHSSSHH